MLEKHSEDQKRNPDQISYDLLDSSPDNSKSVESLYNQAEKWMEESAEHRQYPELAHLAEAYDKIIAWYEPNFEDRI